MVAVKGGSQGWLFEPPFASKEEPFDWDTQVFIPPMEVCIRIFGLPTVGEGCAPIDLQGKDLN